jgi:hypothetical protein
LLPRVNPQPDAANRSHEHSSWDEPSLIQLLEQLEAENALEGVGYSTEDIDALVQKLREEEEIDKQLDDDGPEDPPAVAIAKTGDLWCLGDHRLLCGTQRARIAVPRGHGREQPDCLRGELRRRSGRKTTPTHQTQTEAPPVGSEPA